MQTAGERSSHCVWRVCVDTGGTFTDCLARDPQSRPHRVKVLSSGAVRARLAEIAGPARLRLDAEWLELAGFAPGATLLAPATGARATVRSLGADGWADLESPIDAGPAGSTLEVSTGEPAPVLAARMVTGTPARESLPPIHLRLATTRGTNALLERRGVRPTFFVTEGFPDLLRIGDQTRPDIFALDVRRPPPLHGEVVEVRERIDARGETVRPLDLDRLRADGAAALARGSDVAAVTLLHAWREPDHERRVRDVLLGLGFRHVSISSDLGAAIGALARAETTVANAFLSPVIESYLDEVERPLAPGSRLLVMTSGGGLVDRGAFEPKDSLLSGPAAGVMGAASAGRRAAHDRVITFDMGGTSTDCARCERVPARVYQTRVGDARIVAPAVAVETVAAGGGSVCEVRHGELRVGPESAGADPGPACYGRGGPLTLTDCNLLLGRLAPERFAVPLDVGAARRAAQAALAETASQGLSLPGVDRMLLGFVEIANQRMAEAVRRISLRRGHDPADHALVAFGGAGPQHACAVAEALGVRTVVVPGNAPLLSAEGLTGAPVERSAAEQVLRPLEEALPGLDALLDRLADRARAMLDETDAGGEGAGRSLRLTAELRLLGQDDAVELEARPAADLADRFRERYRATFGFDPAGGSIELVSVRAVAALESAPGEAVAAPEATRSGPLADAPMFGPGGAWASVPRRRLEELSETDPLEGPALVVERYSACVVEAGWRATRSDARDLTLRRISGGRAQAARPEAVELELAIGKLEAVALEMGERLQRTAISTNVRERRDFSCALLDAEGRLVVNAPHVPVHLGSMGVCVRAVRDALGERFGDPRGLTVVTNHPAFGGSHLPDLTVIHPVVDGRAGLLGYAACRAHHAEIGGIAPGSMAPEARTLAEEGVVIPPTPLGVEGGVEWGGLASLFRSGPYPSRAPEINARDLAASIHAVWAGARLLRELGGRVGSDGLGAAFERIRQRAALRAAEAIARIPAGVHTGEERLDDGAPLRATWTVRDRAATVDFTGSAPEHAGCLNATPAIVTSAVIYVLRLLVGEDLPLNEGLLEPVRLMLPRGMLSPHFDADPRRCPAVAGGNVEVSQLLVETMLSALRVCAQSQGTMNNVVFGNAGFGFYETLGGGAGAGPAFPGESAVHSHMTNTALTDPEVFEHRHPVAIERCAIRRGSGGAGAKRGGDGMVREYRLLEPVRVSVLAQRRRVGPRGPRPENEAKCGLARVIAPDGSALELAQGGVDAPGGSRLIVETPGGAGWG